MGITVTDRISYNGTSMGFNRNFNGDFMGFNRILMEFLTGRFNEISFFLWDPPSTIWDY
jgi:hypothetical protein